MKFVEACTVIAAFVVAGLVFAWAANAADLDGDTVDDSVDNCPCIWNPEQVDAEWIGGVGLRFNWDGIGNVCDGDWAGPGGAGTLQDGLVGIPDFDVMAYCLNNGNTGDPTFPVSTVCFGVDMDWNATIDMIDYHIWRDQFARGTPGPGMGEASECAP